MSASVGLQIVGGFYRSRHRYERPNHEYPEWERVPLHTVTDDFLAWTKNVFIVQPIRYDEANRRSTEGFEVSFTSFATAIKLVSPAVKYSDDQVRPGTLETDLVYDVSPLIASTVVATSYYRHDSDNMRTAPELKLTYPDLITQGPTVII